MTIHIGNLIHQYFEKKRIRRAALARVLNKDLRTLIKYEKNESLQTKSLLELCTHLKHNFFIDIAMQLPTEYTTTKNIFDIKDQKIALLEEEIKTLKIERDLLIKLQSREK